MFRRDVEDDDRVYAKRIVGEPGDVIEIRDGQTYINGEVYEETWLNEDPDDLDFGPFEVPEEKYFCMGDNRNKSTDCPLLGRTLCRAGRYYRPGTNRSFPGKNRVLTQCG